MALLYFDPDNKVKNIRGYENWCLSKDSRKLLAGDFNGDSYTDLLCHNQNEEMIVLLNMGGKEQTSALPGIHSYYTRSNLAD